MVEESCSFYINLVSRKNRHYSEYNDSIDLPNSLALTVGIFDYSGELTLGSMMLYHY